MKTLIKRSTGKLFSLLRGKVLSADDLISNGIQVSLISDEVLVKVPETYDWNSSSMESIASKEIVFPRSFVYRLNHDSCGDCLQKYGTVFYNKNIVSTGVDENIAKGVWLTKLLNKKKSRLEPVIMAPWPHRWATYGDFIFFVLPKISRIWSAMTEDERSKAVIVFPFRLGRWAHEYIEELGIPEARHIDSTRTDIGLAKGGTLLAGNGPYHTQSLAHPHDLELMSGFLKMKNVSQCDSGSRFYISRTGRRKLSNEAEVMAKLESLGFTSIPDQPRSVREQMELFSNVDVVAGVHGAGLCNAVWSQRNVKILEVKSTIWDLQSFRVWCASKKGKYSVLYDRRTGNEMALNVERSNEDLVVDSDNFFNAARQLISDN